ncbi:hypothetical protein [uncultured Sphingomonas sp.]|uniref:hypothetical protein n=1 Tax=uncultured Sphingomonas sp. TaxID=158754 RepID=UPI0025F96B11|nr:hypothetical protein [uncultured Sphingomonas sp.]
MTHPTERETCDHCAGTGVAGHPDSGYTCHRCEGSGALAAAPQPAPAPADERAAMIEVIVQADDAYDRVQGGSWAGAIADALLAAGWTRGGDAAGLREVLEAILNDAHETEDGNPYWREVGADALDRARAALARPSAPEAADGD